MVQLAEALVVDAYKGVLLRQQIGQALEPELLATLAALALEAANGMQSTLGRMATIRGGGPTRAQAAAALPMDLQLLHGSLANIIQLLGRQQAWPLTFKRGCASRAGTH